MPLSYEQTKRNPLRILKKIMTVRTFVTYIILLIYVPYTFSSDRYDHFNKTHSIRKRQEDTLESEHVQTSGCQRCRVREEIKKRNIYAIKEKILKQMGFDEAPNITGKILPTVPAEYLARIEEKNEGMQSDQPHSAGGYYAEEEDDYSMKMEKIWTYAQLAPRLRHKGHDILHFSFSNSITKFQVSNATLFLYIRGTERSSVYHDVIVDIYRVRKITDHFEPAALTKVYGRKIPQPPGKGDWVKIDFTETVSEWFRNPRDNHGFLVNATVNGKKVLVTDMNVDKGKRIPYLEISTYESKRRVRRSTALNCDDSSDQSLCCRYPFVVDFGYLGFDFIIAPRTFNSYMCAGECSFLSLQKYLHTHLKQIAMPNSLPPCCTPRKLGSISMLYFDQHMNILSGSMPGMVVERCGCL
ncbi:growth/differentiation factor myoglianin [Leptinotarsa decemlineata]|uniref:growth/differentiation factor myoglianin n=1 Tax=Leptinotarsa decemlineata TaxID=7539 RepID=UPI000C255B7E|nr:growth/differentiation factor 8 [Leptinotarsa decemlineata]